MNAVNSRLPGKKVDFEHEGIRYKEEVELPNGHKWRRRDDGGWCRFSNKRCFPTGKMSGGQKQAFEKGMPYQKNELPDGYHWVKGPNGEPTLRSITKGNDKLTFDSVSKKFITSSGAIVKPGTRYTTNKKSFNISSSPLKIPKKAIISEQIKTGYTQVKFKWTRGKYKYEARWHTPTNPKFKAQGNTWVITRTTPGNSTGVKQVNHIWTGKKWTSMSEWQNAISAQKAGTASESQKAMLGSGHHKSY